MGEYKKKPSKDNNPFQPLMIAEILSQLLANTMLQSFSETLAGKVGTWCLGLCLLIHAKMPAVVTTWMSLMSSMSLF